MSDEVKAEAKKKRGWLVIETYRFFVEMYRLGIEIGLKVMRSLVDSLNKSESKIEHKSQEIRLKDIKMTGDEAEEFLNRIQEAADRNKRLKRDEFERSVYAAVEFKRVN